MVVSSPTGARRFRLHQRLFFKPLLVLQIQIHVTGNADDYGQGPVIDYKYWKDAEVQDISEIPVCLDVEDAEEAIRAAAGVYS